MESEFTFEVLKKKDVKKCLDTLLSAEVGQLTNLKNRDFLKRMIYGDKVLTIVAKVKDRIVGTITASWMMTWPPDISLLTLIDRESAVKGVGLLLIDKLIEAIKERFPQVPFITAKLIKDSTEAVSLYSAKGFTVEGFLKEGLMGKDVIFMKKDLTGRM